MPIALTFIAAMGATWKSVAGQLLASGVAMLSGWQDVRLRSYLGAAFSFLIAIAFGISALATALRASLWVAAGSAAALCLEALVTWRWERPRTSG
ncbi:MAG: hypothetical protein WAU58_05050 [Terriglobales bacterium]|jgi:hypothetical protein